MLRALGEKLPELRLSLSDRAEGAQLCFEGFPSVSEVTAAIDCLGPDSRSSSAQPADRRRCEVTLFCACLGGCGLTTVSTLYAMLLSRLQGRRVMLLSFGLFAPEGQGQLCYRLLSGRGDPASVIERKLMRDEYGVFRASGRLAFNSLRDLSEQEAAELFSRLAESGLFTDIVAELPAGCGFLGTVLSLAERAVLLDDYRRPESPEQLVFAEEFARMREGLSTAAFCPAYDGNAADMDIHGQLGTQIRRALMSGAGAANA